ncbi:hypothetical protein OAR80_02015 [Methylophilaceae bacterium]|nr:hypothetical protein [Methylophilaceae bacterium]
MRKRKILVPYFYHYYLFEYIEELVKELQIGGYEVHLVTSDRVVYEKFVKIGIKTKYAPPMIRLLLKRSGNMFVRSLLWLSGYVWLAFLRNRYDFAIVPWDNKPLWYLITSKIPSLTVHNTTNLMTIDSEIKENKSHESHLVAKFFESILKVNLLPRFCNVVLKHNKYWYLDKFFGMKSDNLLQGFSGLDYITVTGNKTKEILISAGLHKKGTHIEIVGNPAYDGFINFAKKFTRNKGIAYKKTLNLAEKEDLYSLFLSPSSFSETQIKEVMLVFETLLIHDRNASILVKFHPKTEAKYIDNFRNFFSSITSNFLILTGTTGDFTNLNIILSSRCIIQKQSTVGFISMLVSKPIISYNFMKTDYYDDMYKTMNSSLHCSSSDEMLESLSKLSNKGEMQKLKKLQDVGCKNFCKRTSSAASNIVTIIDNHFNNQNKSNKYRYKFNNASQ